MTLKKMMKKRRSQLILSLLSKTQIMKMLMTLDDQLNKKKMRKKLLRLTSLRIFFKISDEENFTKKITEGLFDDQGTILKRK